MAAETRRRISRFLLWFSFLGNAQLYFPFLRQTPPIITIADSSTTVYGKDGLPERLLPGPYFFEGSPSSFLSSSTSTTTTVFPFLSDTGVVDRARGPADGSSFSRVKDHGGAGIGQRGAEGEAEDSQREVSASLAAPSSSSSSSPFGDSPVMVFESAKDFKKFSIPLLSSGNNNVIVLLFYSRHCPHCIRFKETYRVLADLLGFGKRKSRDHTTTTTAVTERSPSRSALSSSSLSRPEEDNLEQKDKGSGENGGASKRIQFHFMAVDVGTPRQSGDIFDLDETVYPLATFFNVLYIPDVRVLSPLHLVGKDFVGRDAESHRESLGSTRFEDAGPTLTDNVEGRVVELMLDVGPSFANKSDQHGGTRASGGQGKAEGVNGGRASSLSFWTAPIPRRKMTEDGILQVLFNVFQLDMDEYQLSRHQSSVYHVLQELSSSCPFKPPPFAPGYSSSPSSSSSSSGESSSSSSPSSSSHLASAPLSSSSSASGPQPSSPPEGEPDQQKASSSSSSSSSPWCSGTGRWGVEVESFVPSRSANVRLHDALAVLIFMLRNWVVAGSEGGGLNVMSAQQRKKKREGGREEEEEEASSFFLGEEKERTLLNFLEICRYSLPGRNIKKELTKLILLVHQKGSAGVSLPPGILKDEASRMVQDCLLSSSSSPLSSSSSSPLVQHEEEDDLSKIPEMLIRQHEERRGLANGGEGQKLQGEEGEGGSQSTAGVGGGNGGGEAGSGGGGFSRIVVSPAPESDVGATSFVLHSTKGARVCDEHLAQIFKKSLRKKDWEQAVENLRLAGGVSGDIDQDHPELQLPKLLHCKTLLCGVWTLFHVIAEGVQAEFSRKINAYEGRLMEKRSRKKEMASEFFTNNWANEERSFLPIQNAYFSPSSPNPSSSSSSFHHHNLRHFSSKDHLPPQQPLHHHGGAEEEEEERLRFLGPYDNIPVYVFSRFFQLKSTRTGPLLPGEDLRLRTQTTRAAARALSQVPPQAKDGGASRGQEGEEHRSSSSRGKLPWRDRQEGDYILEVLLEQASSDDPRYASSLSVDELKRLRQEIRDLERTSVLPSQRVVSGIRDWVFSFFTCLACRTHFLECFEKGFYGRDELQFPSVVSRNLVLSVRYKHSLMLDGLNAYLEWRKGDDDDDGEEEEEEKKKKKNVAADSKEEAEAAAPRTKMSEVKGQERGREGGALKKTDSTDFWRFLRPETFLSGDVFDVYDDDFELEEERRSLVSTRLWLWRLHNAVTVRTALESTVVALTSAARSASSLSRLPPPPSSAPVALPSDAQAENRQASSSAPVSSVRDDEYLGVGELAKKGISVGYYLRTDPRWPPEEVASQCRLTNFKPFIITPEYVMDKAGLSHAQDNEAEEFGLCENVDFYQDFDLNQILVWLHRTYWRREEWASSGLQDLVFDASSSSFKIVTPTASILSPASLSLAPRTTSTTTTGGPLSPPPPPLATPTVSSSTTSTIDAPLPPTAATPPTTTTTTSGLF